ncbi:MAG: hypothetical protein JNM17_14210 [Archangium sp.]|nr:hypothetical protein [Archangium sp.]
MRLLVVLAVTMLSASSCVPALAFVLSPFGERQRLKEGRVRAAAYRQQLEREGAAARRSYNANVRGGLDDSVLTPPPLVPSQQYTPTPPPLVTTEPR